MKILGEFIVEKQHEFSHVTDELTVLLSAIKLGVRIIHRGISKTGLVDIPGTSGAENMQGEVQQKLDLFVNEKLKAVLKACDIVVDIASEEEDEIVVFEDCGHAKYVMLMDPLNGSSNIDVNVFASIILSIYRRVTLVGIPVTEEDFLQPRNKQVATDCVVYGSSIVLVYTTGCDVHAFTYDPSLGVFCLSQERMRFPAKDSIYSTSEGNYTKFPNGVKKYIKFCQEEDKLTQCPYTSRYIGSLVADFHHNLLRDGIYLYPGAASHPQEKLRLLYGRNPMASLTGQTGGKASGGRERVLNITLESLHQRHSFLVGDDHVIEDAERLIREFPGAQVLFVVRMQAG